MSATVPVAEMVREAERLVHEGRFAEGERRASEALAREPSNARARYVLGLSALMRKRPADALAQMEGAAAADPANPQYHFGRGACLASLSRVDESVHAYRRALELRPAFFEAAANLGNVLENAGRYGEAAAAYRQALALRADEPLVLNGLGRCELEGRNLAAAVAALERALALRPDFASAMNNLANAVARLGDRERAVRLLRDAVRIRPNFTEAWEALAHRLYMMRDDAGALEAFDRVLALDPSNGLARHTRDAIAGAAAERAPDEYVRRFFDTFAPEFDQRLVGQLEYRTPERIAEFLAPWLEGRAGLRVADLGCGTGLSGVSMRPKASFLAGVDLSQGMLERARERAIYDGLDRAEIVAWLEKRQPASFDLVLAVDVLVYVGNLEPVARACARALVPGGLFAFSVERLEGAGGDGFRLARTGRYSHADDYVRRVARSAGLEVVACTATDLRKDDGKPVRGTLYALRKA
jgi:predicted TPR repeat methyltransferase